MPDLTQLLDAATGPFPWRTAASGDILTRGREWVIASVDGQDPYGSGGLPIDQDDANAALIVAAVNALPALLAVVDAARVACDTTRPFAALDVLRAALTDLDEVTRA